MKNEVTHAIQLKLQARIKSRFKIIVASYARNKNFDNEIKNQEKADYSLSYRCAAINNKDNKGSQIRKMQFLLKNRY